MEKIRVLTFEFIHHFGVVCAATSPRHGLMLQQIVKNVCKRRCQEDSALGSLLCCGSCTDVSSEEQMNQRHLFKSALCIRSIKVTVT